ncbi:DUF2894 domain-containing protein [uncultured Pseudoteredinibacter sp.]|uniref:DUF2894 domain-containing protein n=1 Tax=uncultured Pseudoteredinibacter sp. TaxID=1641701 RepID=UPI002630B9D5|nr:DUF2894 domain-containing protein [uncultured Pseudoteredinibacter sp.]
MSNVAEALAQLHSRGGHHFDPIRYAYIDALIQRAILLPDEASNLVLAKANKALQRYQRDFEAAEAKQQKIKQEIATENQPAISKLSALTQELLNRDIEMGEQSQEESLTDFLQQQEKAVLNNVGKSPRRKSGSRKELKSLASFRSSWEKMRGSRVAMAVGNEAPENPGPLNQHMLVITTLTKMQELSPAYFNRFVSYMGSLMWLEEAAQEAKSKSKSKGSKKAKS